MLHIHILYTITYHCFVLSQPHKLIGSNDLNIVSLYFLLCSNCARLYVFAIAIAVERQT